jgi:hypothetical protein
MPLSVEVQNMQGTGNVQSPSYASQYVVSS